MCGIAGQFRYTSLSALTVPAPLAALRHRGPDGTGVYASGPVALYHTRLAIIDLAGGHQPLTTQDGELTAVVNGEIYNFVELRTELEALGHVFRTRSDSEVVLHAYRAWGSACVKRLRGMFAFALFDEPNQRLLLARDRLGIKPLFLSETADGVCFASEIKGLLPLLGSQPRIDPSGLAAYFQNQFACGRQTVLAGVGRVLPGECCEIDARRGLTRWRYWSITNVAPRDRDYHDAEREFDDLMAEVMREHMRADVPFGLFLSGGVDSAILLALLDRYGAHPVRTYSVGFRTGKLVDETPAAEGIARRFGAIHDSLHPTRNGLLHHLPRTVWAADELMRDPANLPTALLAQLACRELKVVFTGEGGDEVFAGYGRYRLSAWERHLKSLIHPGRAGFRTRPGLAKPLARRLFNPALAQASQDWHVPFAQAWRDAPTIWSDLQRMQYTDLTTALPDNLLVKADRMLMLSGIEGRVPFLDHRVVEFGMGLPDRLKIDHRTGKAFLRRWASRFLPKDHLYGTKRGFYVPIRTWLTPAFCGELANVLPTNEGIREWFCPNGLTSLLRHPGRSARLDRTIWAIVQFAVWHRLFIEGDGAMPPQIDPLDFLKASS